MYFDIGANIGKWSLANINTCNKIISVEASNNTFNKLINNVIKCSDIICLNYAICNSNDEYVTFYDSETDTLSTLNIDWLTSPKSRFYNTNHKEIKCKTMTIDKLIEVYGIPELIKIDVEGGEFECLSSLTKKVNNICFEWASETNDITFMCLDYLESLGYTQFAIQYEDNYTYRPQLYEDITTIKIKLNNTTPKNEWGMIWTK